MSRTTDWPEPFSSDQYHTLIISEVSDSNLNTPGSRLSRNKGINTLHLLWTECTAGVCGQIVWTESTDVLPITP